ncbi:MAG: hypothetical protein FJY95_13225 [Candidatus Handelsmanbacteria bacterium]|nr:hypothetical protein [Candidatus Handelsmanbacteria bacterium]
MEQKLQEAVLEPDFMPTARRMVGVGWVARTMQADPANHTCQLVPLLDWQGPEHLGGQPKVEVLEHRVWDQRVRLRLRLDGPAYVRLAYAYYPHLAVEVDGRSVEPFETVDHFLALRLDAGEHDIELRPLLSPLRRGLLLLDLLLLGVGTWLWIRDRRNHRPCK